MSLALSRWPAERALGTAAAGCGLLLLLSIYALPSRVLADVVAVAICLVAAGALAVMPALPPMVRAGLIWLGAACGFLAVSALLGTEVTPGEAANAMRGFALIACFLLAARVALERLGEATLLGALFAAGAASAAIAAALHLSAVDPLVVRMVPLGRPINPIPGAAAAAAAFVAGLVLLREGRIPGAWRVLAWAGLAACLLGVVLTHSRGPMLGLLLATLVALLPRRTPLLVLALPPVAFLLASALVPLEHFGRALVCADETLLCRPAQRFPLWQHTSALVAREPLFGMGIQHQIGTGWLNNPQNAAMAMALYYGIPFALACAGAVFLLLRRLARLEETTGLRWATAMLTFCAVYYAFEPNPFAFLNAHYLFLWLPVALVLAAEGRRMSAGGTGDVGTPGGLRGR